MGIWAVVLQQQLQVWLQMKLGSTISQHSPILSQAEPARARELLEHHPEKQLQRLNVLFVFRRHRAEGLQRYKAGEGPDDMLYGLNRFDRQRFDLDFIEGNHHWSWRRLLWQPIEKQIARQVGIGLVLDLALGNLVKLREADLIISTVDACGLPILMLKSLGLLGTPTIYISQGLAHRVNKLPIDSRTRRWVQRLYGCFLRSAERILVLGEGAVAPLVDTFALEPQKVFCIPFGIDAEFWTPGPDPDIGDYILSVGSDQARDYQTLLQAVTQEHLKIVTRLLPPGRLNHPIEVGSQFTDVELRELYRRARFVVIPLKDVDQPSGQSATLQAMACGQAVILSRTRGLWEPDHMRHLENCYLIPPGDVQALRQAMHYLSDFPGEARRIGQNARRTVEERYTSQRFAAELECHVDEVLQFAVPTRVH